MAYDHYYYMFKYSELVFLFFKIDPLLLKLFDLLKYDSYFFYKLLSCYIGIYYFRIFSILLFFAFFLMSVSKVTFLLNKESYLPTGVVFTHIGSFYYEDYCYYED